MERQGSITSEATWAARLGAVLCVLGVAVTAAPAGEVDPTDRDQIEAFFDAQVESAMAHHQVPGAVVVFVQDGEILLSKGYGYADVEAGRPMDPTRTRLAVGSISKLFTATAILQLAQRGELDLHADLNAYIEPIRLDPGFDEPVTAHHLLTHTDGLEQRYLAMAARTPDQILPLESYLRTSLPRRVMPPGRVMGYSNQGFAIAGYLIERIAGQDFNSYMQEHLLAPLHMTRSTFGVAPMEDRAVGYRLDGRGPAPLEPFYIHNAPAGGLTTTAQDMARFMLAHLEGGRAGDWRMLDRRTIQQMHHRQFSHHPQMQGWAYGFCEHIQNNQRALGHGGVWPGFMSKMLLLPEHRQGYFIAYNLHDYALLDGHATAFIDHFYSSAAPASARAAAPIVAMPAKRFEGIYQPVSYSRSTFEKLYTLFMQFRVSTRPDGGLHIERETGGTGTFFPIESNLFRSDCGDDMVYFPTDSAGRVTHMLMGNNGFERLRWYQRSMVHVLAFAGFGVMFAAACLLWLVQQGRALRRRAWRAAPRLSTAAGCALYLAFMVGLACIMKYTDHREFTFGVPWVLQVLLLLPLAAIGLTTLATVQTVRDWFAADCPLPHRALRTMNVLAQWAFVPLLHYWNLLGW